MAKLIDGFSKADLDLVWEWNQAVTELAKLKKLEITLRKKVDSLFFPEPTIGKVTTNLPANCTLERTQYTTRSIDESVLTDVLARLEKKEPGCTNNLIKYKPSLVATTYKTLPDKLKNLADDAIITKLGAVSMKMVTGEPA